MYPGVAMLPASFGALSLDAPPPFLDLLALPRPLALAIFALLPVDTRLRCSEVNRAWRALLADTTLYSRLDLSRASGQARFSAALLRAAVAKAGGQLRVKDITGQRLVANFSFVDLGLLLEIVKTNVATLTELRADMLYACHAGDVRALLEAAPAISLLQTSVSIQRDHQVSRAMLRNEPPFQALQLRRLWSYGGLGTSARMVAFGSDLRCHASLEELGLCGAALDTAAAMGVLVDSCIALHLRKLWLMGCDVSPGALPALTRLIAAGALRDLNVDNRGVQLFDETDESTRFFCTAVRASPMTRLVLIGGGMPSAVVEAVALISNNARSCCQQQRSFTLYSRGSTNTMQINQ